MVHTSQDQDDHCQDPVERKDSCDALAEKIAGRRGSRFISSVCSTHCDQRYDESAYDKENIKSRGAEVLPIKEMCLIGSAQSFLCSVDGVSADNKECSDGTQTLQSVEPFTAGLRFGAEDCRCFCRSRNKESHVLDSLSKRANF